MAVTIQKPSASAFHHDARLEPRITHLGASPPRWMQEASHKVTGGRWPGWRWGTRPPERHYGEGQGFLSKISASLPIGMHFSTPGQANTFTQLPAAKLLLCAFSRLTFEHQANRFNVCMFPAWLCGSICDSECKTGDSVSHWDSGNPQRLGHSITSITKPWGS